VNSATWAMWARVMARSNPPVRGLLGYEEASPAAGASVGIANAFFDALRSKKDFLTAWKAANKGQHWAAIVHKDAHKDTLVSFPQTPLPASTLGDYIGYLPSVPKGEAISDPPPPFELKLFRVAHKGKPNEALVEIRADVLDEAQTQIYAKNGAHFIVQITSPKPITEATIQFIHIRPTYHVQLKPKELFANATSPTANVTIDMAGAKKVVAKASSALTTLEIHLETQPLAKLQTTGLDPSHSYLWISAGTKGSSGSASHDFRTVGVLYG
jgi:hypothetical protein